MVCVYWWIIKEPVQGTPNEKLSVTSVTYVEIRTISCCNVAKKLASTCMRKPENNIPYGVSWKPVPYIAEVSLEMDQEK